MKYINNTKYEPLRTPFWMFRFPSKEVCLEIEKERIKNIVNDIVMEDNIVNKILNNG